MNKLRDQLIDKNKNIFEILLSRKEISKKIQQLKKSTSCLDVAREVLVFQCLKETLISLEDKELLSFSLIMESHAGQSYPAWSEGVHLKTRPQGLMDMINPILLLVIGKLDRVEKRLNDEYLDIIKKEA